MKRKFTLPGEAGYEKLTLELAERWGADVIRDSDGTALSSEILDAGYQIYSTICPIREHNPWIEKNMHARQQTFLSTPYQLALGETLDIHLMEAFFQSQFSVNETALAFKYWQVWDRTTNTILSNGKWAYKNGVVTIKEAVPYRQYSVSFLAWRNWEEISMYNHTTNNWDKEKLMQLNPYAKGCQEYLKTWFVEWCDTHPYADVVRFTSLFYNFAWIWGANPRNRHLFTDWASYDFTVCPEAFEDFAKEYGYHLTAEDFVREGKYQATHRLPSKQKLDWMAFIGKYVRKATRELVDIIHAAGKKAYVFYDDSWVGMEPYNGHFHEMNFDGLIKCVFSGYEARLCSGVDVPTHEIRFHPYLFPVGLGGAPTFSPGGEPGKDAFQYWMNVRRALLRGKIERSGLGGYLHLVEDYPCFVEAMDTILAEFEAIANMHDHGAPMVLKPKIAILHAWGALRTWTLSGHFHETEQHMLIHVLEALSGLPFDVEFICFDSIKDGVPSDIDIIINAGEAGSAWSGGQCWADNKMVETLTGWVHNGGIFVGIGEPSAWDGHGSYLRMAHVLGVDIDNGELACHGRWRFDTTPETGLYPERYAPVGRKNVVLTDGNARVLSAEGNSPTTTINQFGQGKGVYMSGFEISHAASQALQNILVFAAEGTVYPDGTSNNPNVECAIFPTKVVFINNTAKQQVAACHWQGKQYEAKLKAYQLLEMDQQEEHQRGQ